MMADKGWLEDVYAAISDVVMVSVQHPDGTIAAVNDTFCEATGFCRSDLIGARYRDALGDDREPACDEIAESIRRRQPWRGTLRQRRKDGSPFWTEAVMRPFLEDDRIVRIVTVQRDLTRRMETEATLDLVQDQLEAIQKIAHIGSWEWNLRKGTVKCSTETLQIFKLSAGPDRIVPFDAVLERIHPGDRDFVQRVAADIVADRSARRLEFRLSLEDGSTPIVSVEARTTRRQGDEVVAIGGTTHDITGRIAAERSLRRQAMHDPLTGLYNRRAIQDVIDETLEADGVGAVLFIDLDGFKDINDRLGHDIGDDLLCAVADRLQGAVRIGDRIGRVGGDEFVVFLKDVSETQVSDRVAGEIIDKLRLPFQIGPHRCSISASAGVALAPRDGRSVEALVRAADLAMYQVKGSGRNGYLTYQRDWGTSCSRRLEVLEAIDGALERGEFLLHYQPQFCLTNRKIISVEALLRWTSPRLGAVSPAEFIPVLEQSGSILKVGAWTLEQACRDAATWAAAGDPIRVAVNVSYAQIARGCLTGAVTQALSTSGLDPELLELELTESMFGGDVETVAETLHDIRKMGVSIAVDDFGVGYSSFGHLKRFPVNVLKIDKVFTEGVHEGGSDTAIIGAIVNLAHSLGMRVVAEGIEKGEAADVCHALGCHVGQGWHFGRPVPAEEIRGMIIAKGKRSRAAA